MLRDFLIESRPAAIAALETQLPGESAPEHPVDTRGILRPHQTQRHQHHRRVVGVGIINVVVFERPTARFRMRIVHGPVATESDFSFRKPVRCLLQRWVLRGEAGFAEGDDVDRRVPNGRETRLDAKIFRIINEKPSKIFRRFFVYRMGLGIAESAQGNQRIQHRRKYRGQAIAAFADSIEHPALRFFQCALRASVATESSTII